jgi:hypothetical protein
MDDRCDIAGEVGGVRIGQQVDSHLMSIPRQAVKSRWRLTPIAPRYVEQSGKALADKAEDFLDLSVLSEFEKQDCPANEI